VLPKLPVQSSFSEDATHDDAGAEQLVLQSQFAALSLVVSALSSGLMAAAPD
jgi:hypothetical protein